MTDAKDKTFDAGEADEELTGKGFYPAFHGLWHLQTLGVIDDLSDFAVNNRWSDLKTRNPIRVALIDTPVAYDHPNLKGAIDLALMRDFSVYDEGIFAVAQLRDARDKIRRQTFADRIRAKHAPSPAEEAFLAECNGAGRHPNAAPKFFGAHGTAMAGLIAGRPTRARCVIPTEGPWETGDPVIPHIDDRVLPYAGINPFCNIVPVSTTAAPVPSMVLAALDYAQFIQADVVVIAAAWEDSEIYTADLKHCPERWSQVDAKLKELARTAVVLCAAGNSGKTELAYPALLAKQAQIPNLLAVTACDAFGKVLGAVPSRQAPPGQQAAALTPAHSPGLRPT